MKFCTNCGGSIQPGLRFCPSCGAPVAVPQILSDPEPSAIEPVLPPVPDPGSASGWETTTDVAVQPSAGAWADVPGEATGGGAAAASEEAEAEAEAPSVAPSASPTAGWSDVPGQATGGGAEAASEEAEAPSVLPEASVAVTATAASEWQTLPSAPVQMTPIPPDPPATAVPTQAVAPVAAAGPRVEPQPADGWKPTPPPPPGGVPGQPAASGKNSCLPIILIVLAVVVVIGAAVVGGVVYMGYKIKQKATAMVHENVPNLQSRLKAIQDGTDTPSATTPGAGSPDANSPEADATRLMGSLSGLLGGEDDGDLVQSVSEKDPVEACTEAPFPSQANAKVPLVPGTVMTTAWGIKNGDVETRITIDGIDNKAMSLQNKCDAYKNDFGQDQKEQINNSTICNADYASANTYVTVVGKHIPPLIHDLTRLRVSAKTFQEAKATGKTFIRYADFVSYGETEKPMHDGGDFTRVEAEDVPYPMIVNDERVTLPAIHLTAKLTSVGKDPRPKKMRPSQDTGDIYFIDDPADPLVLLWKESDPVYHNGKFRVEVVKIDYKVAKPVNIVEKQLSESKRAVTYGIYFDFNKDTIKPESEKVLKEIVQAMTDNPDWKLTVEGHTDNIGGDTYNLDLSKRRAAAVKDALVTRYHIVADRLSTNGFGALRPVDTNDTLEGRARNRRVELTRE